MMGATLANRGVNPKTHKRLLDGGSVPELLSIMRFLSLVAGLVHGCDQLAHAHAVNLHKNAAGFQDIVPHSD